jgi:hypothetical protein
VPARDIPPRPWGPILLGAAVLGMLLVAGWELYWRSTGVTPGYYNSNSEWAQQRRRIDEGEGGKTVLLGASRVLFDVQLPVWEKATGERPIQLAIEGTSPLPMLEDLAADPHFTGRALVGVAPQVFFPGIAARSDVVPYFHKEGPSQRIGTWLSMHLLEPYFAFYDPDFKLNTVVKAGASRGADTPRPAQAEHVGGRPQYVCVGQARNGFFLSRAGAAHLGAGVRPSVARDGDAGESQKSD